MKQMRTAFLFLMSLILGQSIHCQDTIQKDGWNFGLLPSVMFDSDIGFQYGGIVNAFHYGDGAIYPEYRYMIYAEWSRQTKGGAINQLFFDAPDLFGKKLRLTTDLSYLTEKALDFYGFNGKSVTWNPNLADEEHADYISRMYYRHQRKLIRLSTDIQGPVATKLNWIAGLGYQKYDMATVDLDDLNKGLTGGEQLPDTTLLYDHYVNWGLIPKEKAEGGEHLILKAGLIYDSRDNEANPMQGMWSEAVLWYHTGIIKGSASFTRYNLAHRHYFTLKPKVLSVAFRLAAQGSISGEAPWYILPQMLSSFDMSTTRDGLGGAKTIRGINRNRVVGEGMAFSNVEVRWKFIRTRWLNQNLYFALSAFTDGGMVYKSVDLDMDKVPEHLRWDEKPDKPHFASGLGLHIAMNENFIIAIDYGRALNKDDGDGGLYMNIGYLF